MKIFLDDGMQISLGTGIGKYSEHLARALSEIDGVSVDLFSFKPKEESRKAARLEYLRCINSISFREMAESYDLCIFTNYAVPFRRLETKTVVTVHDLAVYDCPETLPRTYIPYGRLMIENSVRKADAVVTVSKTMRDAISSRYPRASRKTTYAWPGLYDHIGISSADNPYDDAKLADSAAYPFFLMVGTVEKRKNVEFVINAFAKFLREGAVGDDYRLILAGRPGYGFEEIERAARSSGCSDSIVFTGYVTGNDCKNLYRDARAMIFPTVYEGFGSTQIECMVMGLPIVLSDIPTNREVSRDYGVYFKLGNVDGLARALGCVAGLGGSPRLAELAACYIPEFNWERVAERYMAVVSNTGGENKEI